MSGVPFSVPFWQTILNAEVSALDSSFIRLNGQRRMNLRNEEALMSLAIGDGTWDLVGSYGLVVGALPDAEVEADEDERQ